MNFVNKLKLYGGVLVVLAVVTSLFLYMNDTMTHVASRHAELQAETYSVGTDYSGVIVREYVGEGDLVHQGQTIATLKSTSLIDDLASGRVKESDLIYPLDQDRNIVIKATYDGTVANVLLRDGSFVPDDSQIMTLYRAKTAYVEATYRLSPPDYAHVVKGSKVDVTLPNNQVVSATVYDIALENNGKTVETVVKARLGDEAFSGYTFASGTPVDSKLNLSDKSLFDTLADSLGGLIKPSR